MRAAARAVLQDQIAGPLGRSVEEVAYGVLGIANALMARSVRSVTTSRGRDPREFALLAFGGGGGLHAVGLAASLGMRRVVVPPAAGVFSAFGLLFADIEFAQSQGLLVSLDDADPARLGAVFEDIEASVLHHLARPASAVRLRRRADLRYAGQAFELTVDVPDGPLDAAAIEALSAAFDAEHARSYGHSLSRTHKREIVALRVVGTVATERPESRLSVRTTRATDEPQTRSAYFGELGWREAAIVGREALMQPIAGPLIVEEPDSTTIVPPGWTATLDHKRNIIVDQDGELPQ